MADFFADQMSGACLAVKGLAHGDGGQDSTVYLKAAWP